jgi:transcriptional regulator of acetoin/glycerol metabolism
VRVFTIANNKEDRISLAVYAAGAGCEAAAARSPEQLLPAIERASDVGPQAFAQSVQVYAQCLPDLGGDFTLDEIERRHVSAVLARTSTLDEAARILGIDLSTLWRKRKKYELS